MRRPHKVTLMLSDEERARLLELARETGLSQSCLLRSVLQLAAAPAPRAHLLRVVRAK